MQHLQPAPVRTQAGRTVHVSTNLLSGSHAFVRRDARRKPLQPVYDGPFKILQRSNKHYTMEVHGRREVISLDRLKPAHYELHGTLYPLLPLYPLFHPLLPRRHPESLVQAGVSIGLNGSSRLGHIVRLLTGWGVL